MSRATRDVEPARGTLLDNLSSLYLVQIVNYAAPLLAIPFLTRVLGPGAWGDFAFADGYARSAMLLLEFGFQLSGARDIARHRADIRRQSSMISATIAAQLLILLAVAALTAGLILLVPAFSGRRGLIVAGLFWAFAQAMLPLWYFQGREEFRPAAMLDAAAKVAALLAIVALVRQPGDGAKAFVIQGAASAAASTVAFGIIFKAVPWTPPTLRASWSALTRARTLFVYRAMVTLFTTANVVILGLFAPSATVGHFAAAEKLYRAGAGLFHPLNQALYPVVSRLLASDPGSAAAVLRRSAAAMLAGGGLMCIGCYAWAGEAVAFVFGAGFEESAAVLRVLALALPATALVNVIGLQWLLPHGLDGYVTGVIAAGGVANLVLAVWLVPGGQAVGMAWAVFWTVSLVAAGYCAVVYAKKVNPLESKRSGGAW